MKIILYGLGGLLKEHIDKIDDSCIVAIADKKADELDQIPDEFAVCRDLTLITPMEISNYSYDYVAIGVKRFEQAKQQLICENGIDADKIISLKLLVNSRDEAEHPDNEVEREREELYRYYRELNISVPDVISQVSLTDNMPSFPRYSTVNAVHFIDGATYLPGFNISPKGSSCLYNNVAIYVVTHKQYDVFDDTVYRPITVGRFHKDGWQWEGDGDNISELNPKINECTALYWIWKNSDVNIVGITHYRRYFYNNELRCRENRLDALMAEHILDQNDYIVYQADVPLGQTVEEELKGDLDPEAYNYGYNVIEMAIKRYQPDYLSDFYEALKSHRCCYCNMMVAKRSAYNSYCEWLFSFLIPAAREADVSSFDDHNSRVIGFFAERMFSVWLHHNNAKIKSLPAFVP